MENENKWADGHTCLLKIEYENGLKTVQVRNLINWVIGYWK